LLRGEDRRLGSSIKIEAAQTVDEDGAADRSRVEFGMDVASGARSAASASRSCGDAAPEAARRNPAPEPDRATGHLATGREAPEQHLSS
jgi:hypothetical protein